MQEPSVKTLLEQKQGSALFIGLAFLLGAERSKYTITKQECEIMLNNMRIWLSKPIGEVVEPLPMLKITDTYTMNDAIMDSFATMVEVIIDGRKSS